MLAAQHISLGFLTSEISLKKKLKIYKFEREVILEVFNHQK
jgi:hypothetical protein